MKKLITLISLLCVLFIGGAAPIMSSEIDYDKFQLLAANAYVPERNEKTDLVNSEDIEVKIQLNSGLGKHDWSSYHQLAVGTQFQYRIQISNINRVIVQSDLLLSGIDSECVKVKNAKIQNTSLEKSANQFLIPATLFEYGESLILSMDAEYLGSAESCATSLTISVLDEDFIEFRTESNVVGVGRGGCEKVEVVIDSSFSFIDAGGKRCCFELQIRNEYPELNAVDNIMITGKDGDGLSIGTGGLWWINAEFDEIGNSMISFRPDDLNPIPNTGSDWLPFLRLCYFEENIPQEEEFYWRNGDSIICSTTLELECAIISSTESFSYKQELKVFPNPANSHLNIQVEKDMNDAKAIIYSSDGRRVQVNTLDFFSKTATLDIGNLSDGLYILQLQTEDGESEMIKFVKMN